MRMKDKRTVVSGGASGIGEAIVRLFAAEGACVCIADMNEEAGEAIAAELRANGANVIFKKTDVTSEQSFKDTIEAAVKEFGGLDALVNNAGIVEKHDTLLENESIEEWNKIVAVNLHGNFHGSKAALPYLRETQGAIVNMASISGLLGTRYCPAYVATKHAINGLTRSLAADYAPFHVRVNAVCPGVIKTPMIAAMHQNLTPAELAEKEQRLGAPSGRFGLPEEVAQAVLFLASDESTYTSGLSLAVDGGFSAI